MSEITLHRDCSFEFNGAASAKRTSSTAAVGAPADAANDAPTIARQASDAKKNAKQVVHVDLIDDEDEDEDAIEAERKRQKQLRRAAEKRPVSASNPPPAKEDTESDSDSDSFSSSAGSSRARSRPSSPVVGRFSSGSDDDDSPPQPVRPRVSGKEPRGMHPKAQLAPGRNTLIHTKPVRDEVDLTLTSSDDDDDDGCADESAAAAPTAQVDVIIPKIECVSNGTDMVTHADAVHQPPSDSRTAAIDDMQPRRPATSPSESDILIMQIHDATPEPTNLDLNTLPSVAIAAGADILACSDIDQSAFSPEFSIVAASDSPIMAADQTAYDPTDKPPPSPLTSPQSAAQDNHNPTNEPSYANQLTEPQPASDGQPPAAAL